MRLSITLADCNGDVEGKCYIPLHFEIYRKVIGCASYRQTDRLRLPRTRSIFPGAILGFPMADFKGVTANQQRELQEMLRRLSALWAELTRAAQTEDRDRVAAIQREIANCRALVEAIKRAGTIGSA